VIPREHTGLFWSGLIIWLCAMLYTLIIPSQSDFQLLTIGFPLAIVTYILFICSKPIGKKLQWLIIVGILVRLVSIFFFPQLSDDIYRFIWDGRLAQNGIQPYAYLPIDIVEQIPSLADGDILSKMNSPEYYTVYPPVSQFVFYLGSWLGLSVEISSILMKSIFFISELATLFFSLKILKWLKLSPSNILVYWLNPLIIIEGIGNLHFEIIMIGFLSVSIYYWLTARHYLAIVFLAFSVGSKLLSLLILPYLLWQIRWKDSIIVLVLFIAVSLLIFSPLLVGLNYDEFLSSIDLYFRKFEFNAGFYYVLRWLGFQVTGYNLIAYIGPLLGLWFIIITLWITIQEKVKNPIVFLYLVTLIYLLFSTTIHPWYLSIPLFCSIFIRSRVAVTWSCLIWLTYINYNEDVYFENLWIVGLEYIFLLVYILYEMKRTSALLDGEIFEPKPK